MSQYPKFMNKHLTGAMLTLAFLCLSSCGHDSNGPMTGKGSIAPTIELNTSVESSRETARSGSEITVADLALTISKKDGSYTKTWASVNDYPQDTKFSTGQYLVEASYGSVEDEGFEKPAYYGSTEVTVVEDNVTPVTLTASLANAMVSIDYTETLKNYMESYNAQIHAEGGDYVSFAQDETRPAYIRPGNASLTVTFTKPGASAPVSLKVAQFDALARHHYFITVDIKQGAGDAVLVVTLDESVDQQPVEIELSDDLINAPAPVVTPKGLANGDVINHVAGTDVTNSLQLNIVALGTLSEVTLTTQGRDLVGLQGWPAEINLLTADAAMQSRLKQLGLSTVGLWKNPDKMAVIDFTEVLKAIRVNATDNNTSFALQVTDRLGKTSEVFSFSVNLEPQAVSLANPSALYLGEGRLSLDMTYNGGNPDNVTIEYLNDRGTWTPTTASRSVASRAAETYRLTVNVPADNKEVKLRARTPQVTSDVLTIQRAVPAYSISCPDNDTWAKKAYVTVSSSEVDADALLNTATVFVSADGTSYTQASSTVENGKLLISGLTPNTSYHVAVSLTESASQLCTPVTITTEQDINVPNADFEDLEQTLHEAKLNQGGEWGVSLLKYYQSYLTYTISEPTGWTSVNKKTTSSSTRNSWFVVPSTFNTSLTWQSTAPASAGFGGGTETPASYSGFTAKSGANAMVVRNVAWSPAGTVPQRWQKAGIGLDEHYNHNVADVSNTAIGKLFLGNYSYADGTETYDEGVNFTSRPSALSFFYQYTCDASNSNEKAKVTVQVMNGSTVIGSGTAEIGPSVDYVLHNIHISYVANAPKATSIRVMFAASNLSDADVIPTSVFNSKYESAKHGATLVVDNLSLAY